MKKIIGIFVLIHCIVLGYGQYSNVTETMDEPVKKIYREHLEYNKKTKEDLGYRVRIFRDNSQNAKTKAIDITKKLRSEFPDLPTPYLHHIEPYFIVSVGDYRTKDGALKTLLRIKKSFPKAFISHLEPIDATSSE